MKIGKLFYCCMFFLIGITSANVVSNQSFQKVPSIEFLKIDNSGSIHIEGELSPVVALGNEIGASFNFLETHKSSLKLS